MTVLYAFAPITKRETTEDGHLLVHGKATGPDLDLDQQVCDPDWLAKAMPAWFQTGANVREMHQAKAAGKGVELERAGDDWMLTSKIIDAEAKVKCAEEVYTGYSIGIKNARVMKDAAAPNGRIVGGDIIEVSIVDRPANPTAKMIVAKAANGDMDLFYPDADQVEPVEGLVKRDYSDDERADMADSGQAMPGGGFPIKTKQDLKNAIEAIGRAKNPAAAKAHIKARAAALGCEDLIPDSWKAATPDGSDDEFTHDAADLAAVRAGLVRLMQAELDELMAGENELWDVSDLLQSLALFLGWWQHEADDGEVDDPAQPHIDVDDPTAPPADGEDVTMAVTPDETVDTVKASTPEPVVPPFDPAEVERRIAEAVTKATQPLEAALDGLRGDMAKVMSMATPGGPARIKSPQQATTARTKALEADLAYYKRMSDAVSDPQLRQGYQERAKAIQAEITTLATTH